MVVGCLLGGFIPLATYFIAHFELDTFWSVNTVIVLGGLAYSAKTVWQWTYLAFDCRYKATGFVMLTEGVMVFSHTPWLAVCALSYLIGINAVATGCLLALRDRRDMYKKPVGRPRKEDTATVEEEDSGVRSKPTRRKAA
jgi:uncharacterized membrane protein HdeD (DUF308 family)